MGWRYWGDRREQERKDPRPSLDPGLPRSWGVLQAILHVSNPSPINWGELQCLPTAMLPCHHHRTRRAPAKVNNHLHVPKFNGNFSNFYQCLFLTVTPYHTPHRRNALPPQDVFLLFSFWLFYNFLNPSSTTKPSCWRFFRLGPTDPSLSTLLSPKVISAKWMA